MTLGTADGMLDRRMVHSLNGSLSVLPVGCWWVLVIVVMGEGVTHCHARFAIGAYMGVCVYMSSKSRVTCAIEKNA